MGMDHIITDPHPNFTVIKMNYPHFYHLRGRNNEPCYYEKPPEINLKALRAAGVGMDDLLRHFALTCEFMWTLIEPSEDGKSIYIIDLNGMGMRDFAGEVVDFVKETSAFTAAHYPEPAAHYPERSGNIFVINVPSWFSIIWKTVSPWIDPVTRFLGMAKLQSPKPWWRKYQSKTFHLSMVVRACLSGKAQRRLCFVRKCTSRHGIATATSMKIEFKLR